MQYRYEREQSEPAGTCEKKGTVVFRLVPLQGEVSGSVLDFIPKLHRSLLL